ncbi:hypothetical protein AACH06_25625 [Ideonella sp. DXS29W]|uniref:Uncharacterized protein n=1 Tax=Ideonella lacteola TaxID=2984193 RepID=A0ABU9BWH3_9BURK
MDDPESDCQDKLASTLQDWLTSDTFCASSLVGMRALVAQMLDTTPETVSRGQEPNGQWLRRLHGALLRDLSAPERRTCVRRSLEFIGLAAGREPYVLGAARWQRIRVLIDQVCSPDNGNQAAAARSVGPQTPGATLEWASLAITESLCGLLSPQRTRLVPSNLASLGQALDELRAATNLPPHTQRSAPDDIGLQAASAMDYSEMSADILQRLPEVVLASLGLLDGAGLQLLGPVNWMKVSNAVAMFRRAHSPLRSRPPAGRWWRTALERLRHCLTTASIATTYRR